MSNIQDVMQTCLQDVQNGVHVEAVLERYPDLADELRPMLQASLDAQSMAVSGPSSEVLRRNRAKVLQYAASLREESKASPGVPFLQRWAMGLALLFLFFFSGTSLVHASSAALPGDSLYSVKRSWEDLMLAFTFDLGERETLEVEHENERLHELQELFASGRTAQVDFGGIITRENGEGWWISNVLVIVPDQILPPGQPIQMGMAVRVYGITRGDGIVLAERITILAAGEPLPEMEEEQEPEIEVEAIQPQATETPAIQNTGTELAQETPQVEKTETPEPLATPENESIEGTLTSIKGSMWKLDNILIDVADAEIKGIPVIGALARAEGYFDADEVFIASKIEIFNASSSGGNLRSKPEDEDDSSNLNSGVNPDGTYDNHDREDDENHNDDHIENEHQDNVNQNEYLPDEATPDQ